MTKKKSHRSQSNLFPFIALLLIGLAIAFFAATTIKQSQQQGAMYATADYGCDTRPTLMQGSEGKCVKKLQSRLKYHGYKVTIDGKFGPKTLAAVKKFQRKKDLTVNGVVGPKTWKALMKESE